MQNQRQFGVSSGACPLPFLHISRYKIVQAIDWQHVDMDVPIAGARGFHHHLQRVVDSFDGQGHTFHQEHHRRVQCVFNVVKARDMRIRHHHEVTGIDGVNGEQHGEVLILVHPVARDILAQELTEEAVGSHP